MPVRRVATQRMYARLELDGGLVNVARPLCALPGSTSVDLPSEAETGTYLRLCFPLQRICGPPDANTTAASGFLGFIGEST